jgi:hypothetical protein
MANKTSTKKSVKRAAPNKSARVVALMRSAKGCTRKQALKATGWKAISFAQVASGFKIKIDDSARPYRYSIKA